jgi:hypothetical protein
MRELKLLQQGSEEWLQARCGVVTASNFSKVFTTAGKLSTSRDALVNQAIAENLMGHPVDSFKSEAMQRGNDLEPQARAMAEMLLDVDIAETGLVKLDDHEIGCSPDGVWDDTAIEMKCPNASTHVGYLRAGKMPTTYIQQIQGQMLVLELESMWFLSFHPDLPPFLIEVKRDEKLLDLALPLLIETADIIKEQTQILRSKI